MSDTTYLVTARKYRPQLFKDVVAQEHVTGTLKNAIRLDRLAHAYMFTGPRGVGKTTAARILAKAINCTTPAEEREDEAEPCRECVSCQSFEEGRNLNIIEIDAASNNRVDDVRDLRETVRIPPQGNRMKVYIVDEVHMLSNAAFNALLKTLEEPPPHALFIFATTEPHKVLPTIQSRCQRFDFRRIAINETVERLEEICEAERIEADEESLMLIARKGDGALRDALSVFDQAVSLCGTKIEYDELAQALGVVDTDLFFDVARAVRESNSAAMIRTVERVVRSGYDLYEFLDGLSEHLRNLLVAATIEDDSFLPTTEAMRKRIARQAAEFNESTLLRLIQIVGDAGEQLKSSRQPRLHLEMALLRMASLPESVDIRSALSTLDRIEKMASNGNVEFTHRKPAPSPLQPATEKPDAETESPDTSDASDGDSRADDDPGDPPPPPAPPEEPSGSDGASNAPTDASPETDSDPDGDDSELSLFLDPPAIKKKSEPSAGSLSVEPSGELAVMEADDEPVTETDDLGTLKRAWKSVVADVMEAEKQLGSFLRHTEILGHSGHGITLSVPDDFHARALRADRARLAHRLTDAAGIHIDRIRFSVIPPDPSEETDHTEGERDAREHIRTMCEENPAVRELMERFGGEIVW